MESVTSLTKSSLGAKVRAVSKRVEREWAGEITYMSFAEGRKK